MALSFTAANLSFVNMTNTATLKVGQTAGTEASYSFWCKINGNPPATQILISTGGLSMLPHVNSSGILRCDFDYPTAATTFGDSATSVTDNAWHHVVTSHSDIADLSKIYVDNVQKLSTTKNDFLSASGTHRFLVGARSTGASTQDLYFSGLITEVRVYNKQLTAGEVSDLYNMYTTVAAGNLVARWRFKDGSGTNANDEVTTLDGTLTFGTTGSLPTWSTNQPVIPRALSETITIAETSLSRLPAKTRTASDGISIGESLTRPMTKVRALGAQTITIAEDLQRTVVSNPTIIEKGLTETITIGAGSLARMKASWRIQP